mmetsp:Transcript_135602/g.377659  ORF Transcript_135602/g.377659 Transcript_135602/m.377659 type:complete len:228 (+) Transcript_135602:1223-1906(+)
MGGGGGGSSLGSTGRTETYQPCNRLAFQGCNSTSQRRIREVSVSSPFCLCAAKLLKSSAMRPAKGGPNKVTSRVRRAARLPLAVRPAPSASSQPRRSAGFASTWIATSRAACSAAGRPRESRPPAAPLPRPGAKSVMGCGAIRNSWRRCRRKRAMRGSWAYASSYSECCKWACKWASSSLSNAGLRKPGARGARLPEPVDVPMPVPVGAHMEEPEPAAPAKPSGPPK